jgi:hypothetical protein
MEDFSFSAGLLRRITGAALVFSGRFFKQFL